MSDVAVIDDPAAAEVCLDPMRARLLAELVEERKKGNVTERVLRATALSYVTAHQSWLDTAFV